MESITFELACSTGDPLDRTLSLLIRDANGLVVHRAWRLAEHLPITSIMASVCTLVVAWARPSLWDDADYFELLDQVQDVIAVPF